MKKNEFLSIVIKKTKIRAIIFLIIDLIIVFYINSLHKYEMVDEIYQSTGILYYGIIQIQYLYILYFYMRYHNIQVMVRRTEIDKTINIMYRDIILLTIIFILIYAVLFYIISCFMYGISIKLINHLIKNLIMQFFTLILFGRVYQFIYLIKYHLRFSLLGVMLLHFLCLFYYRDYISYFILTEESFNYALIRNVLVMNLFLNLIIINMKKGDIFIET